MLKDPRDLTKVIPIKSKTIGRAEINQFIEVYKGLLKDPTSLQQISLKAEPGIRVEDIDLLLINCFMLVKVRFPVIEIEIDLPYPSDVIAINERIKKKMTQCALYAYLMTGKNVFRLKLGEDPHEFNFSEADNFGSKTFSLSDSFMLFLFISGSKGLDGKLYDLLFIDKNPKIFDHTIRKLVDKVGWSKSTPYLHELLNTAVVAKSFPGEDNRIDCILNLGLLAYFKVLSDTHVLSIHVFREEIEADPSLLIGLKTSLISAVKKGDVYEYHNLEFYNEFSSVLNELSTKALIYHFVFANLLSSELLEKTVVRTTKQSFIEKVYMLWDFTKDLVHGLGELAKNIREHSTSKQGVISANMVKDINIPDSMHQFDRYLNINVLDLGDTGIMEKTYLDTKALHDLASSDIAVKDLLKRDMTSIHNSDYKLRTLFGNGQVLNQQAKRSIAHLGILIFKELISSNKGFFAISSLDDCKQPDYVLTRSNFWTEYNALRYGTHYDIWLPIDRGKDYRPHLLHPKPPIVTEQQIKSMESLLGYRVIELKLDQEIEFDVTEELIFSFCFPDKNMNEESAEEDLVKIYNQVSEPLAKHTGAVILHLNLDKVVQLDESHLFRFLGYIEGKTPSYTIILSHIKNDLVPAFVKLNFSYTRMIPGLGFWNHMSPTILLSYEKEDEYIEAPDNRFYFSDVLWGGSFAEFLELNRALSVTQFNSVSLNAGINVMAGEETTSGGGKPSSPLFINKDVFLPVDLLIKHRGNQSVFENNASLLLKAELKHEYTK